ncbi:hypothetical protein NEF87_004591 [Candidatus Lokiarchaeum ossiferum]|uniref:4Fe-4S ferredoxin-type domain-containing protein n=1 Tax=Candidatus Lokiarchaeum ossiferum TaxID=2951803 RepID=A0ABY6HY81_9ARCH|nr:hypothetical protein NEF87_004591 [Candidatus Lokiarchaeum sp. B-35]
MTWMIDEGCYGCGRCTFCNGIEMVGSVAQIVDQSANCIDNVAQMCPAGIIHQI